MWKIEFERKAVELEFSAIGVASAQTSMLRKHIEEWLKNGYHGTMGWMERTKEKRLNPEEVLPGAKSIITVAVNYYTNPKILENHLAGRISRYAWGDDYHEVVLSRVKEFANVLSEKVPGCKVKCYVDTGPVMEKFWAEQGGVGWIGKHTNLINRQYGSWIFLGEILTDLELTYDLPHDNYCGSCTRCIEACPTKAIIEPYKLDASRCISYLTIEHCGDIPYEFHKGVGSWIYGCDICQEVCPWNRFSKMTNMPFFQSRSGFNEPKLDLWQNMSQEEFLALFKGSPIKRIKLERILRNINVALNNNTS